ncbi:TNF receptor-associated factor 6-like isoform X3 [Oopsacas minuta]|uniref:TNF receptor-associated factor 6-like isoform X3 n=1 Tax=Oopsacas minuta TaxID=111878 RepID=A0AAV7KPD8_9METZ|nr:TNF receptor-associated factor 6-like isoform X3 [Oopsacas minuta]
MAEKITDSEGREDLVYIKTEDGSYRGWRVDLLVENLSSKMELKLLISCPLKKRGCEWSDTVTTAIHHLEECEFFPVLCPLGCVCLEGERKGKVLKLEKRQIPEHQSDSCPLRELVCEFCVNNVKACEMNPHLEDCEHFPVPCPNECVREGEEVTRQLKRRDVPVHLTDVCPLQKVECPYWLYGCREEMERRELDLHEREFMHIHYRLSMADMKLKHIGTSKLLQDKLDTATQRILLVENMCESKSKELSELTQKQIVTNDKLDEATRKIAFLQNENASLTEELAAANTKIENFERHITMKNSELESVKSILFSYTPLPLPTGQLEWKIQGVKQKIENKENTFTDPFYVGLYKCQDCIQWNRMDTGKVAVYIHIMKGGYDDKLHWPIRYKFTFILLNHINSNNNYEYTEQVTKEYLENFADCFKRPT